MEQADLFIWFIFSIVIMSAVFSAWEKHDHEKYKKEKLEAEAKEQKRFKQCTDFYRRYRGLCPRCFNHTLEDDPRLCYSGYYRRPYCTNCLEKDFGECNSFALALSTMFPEDIDSVIEKAELKFPNGIDCMEDQDIKRKLRGESHIIHKLSKFW